MLPATSSYTDAASRTNAFTGALILKIETPGGNAKYFSDREIRLTGDDVLVRSGVLDITGLDQRVDLESFETNDMAVEIRALSAPQEIGYSAAQSGWVYGDIASVAAWSMGRRIQIYLYPGLPAVQIDDCLQAFDGAIVSAERVSDGEIVIRASQTDRVAGEDFLGWNAVIPAARFDDGYQYLEAERLNETMPVVYGNMEEKRDPNTLIPIGQQTGFAVCSLFEKQETFRYQIAHHTVYDTGWPWIYIPQIDSWAYPLTYPTLYLSATGNVGDISYRYPEWYVGIYPSATYVQDSGILSSTVRHVTDGDPSSYLSVTAASASLARVVFEFQQKGSDTDDYLTNSVGECRLGNAWLTVRQAPQLSVSDRRVRLWHNGSWNTSTGGINGFPDPPDYADNKLYRLSVDNPAWASVPAAAGNTFWHLGSGTKAGDGTPAKVCIEYDGSGWTAGTTEVARIYLCRLEIKLRMPRTGQTPEKPESARGRRSGRRGGLALPQKRVADLPAGAKQPLNWAARTHIAEYSPADFVGWECKGRTFESFPVSRPDHPDSLGDLIVYPGDVIESILRDELGIGGTAGATTRYIDTGSFDALRVTLPLSGAVPCYLNLPAGTEERAKGICERIGWEQSFFVFRRRNGQFRVVDAFGSGSIPDPITPEDLYGGLVSWQTITPNDLRNVIDILHSRLPVNASFNRTVTAEDTESQSVFGTTGREIIETETLRQSPADGDSDPTFRLAARLTGTAGMRSRYHYVVRLQTRGWRYATLEIGDSFTLDSRFDGRQTNPRRVSWTEPTFVVYGTTINAESVTIDAIDWTGFLPATE